MPHASSLKKVLLGTDVGLIVPDNSRFETSCGRSPACGVSKLLSFVIFCTIAMLQCCNAARRLVAGAKGCCNVSFVLRVKESRISVKEGSVSSSCSSEFLIWSRLCREVGYSLLTVTIWWTA